jgi:glycosyltransferase involved in cell wall biosynthesis
MKVLMIAPQPFFQPRGTPFSVLHRLTALSKLGYRIDLATYPIGENVAIDGVNIHRAAPVPFVRQVAIGPSKAKIFLDVSLYRMAVSLLRETRYDLIHTHEEAGFFGIRLSRTFDTLHLYDMHSSLPQQLRNFKYSRSKILLRLFEGLEDATIRSAQAVITICPELFNYVKQRFPEKYNKLIENVADNSLVFGEKPANGDGAAQLDLNGDRMILYTGTFEPYQGLDLLIDSSRMVLEKHGHVRFVVVGGKPQQVDFYKRKAAAAGVEKSYTFTGQVPPQSIPHFMDLAKVLVSPRVDGNNTPLKIYSYLRSGVPIVATRHVTHTQVLNDEVSVLTECQAEAFGRGILSVLEDDGYAARLGKNAQALAEREYSYEAYLKKTREIYEYLENLVRNRKARV